MEYFKAYLIVGCAALSGLAGSVETQGSARASLHPGLRYAATLWLRRALRGKKEFHGEN